MYDENGLNPLVNQTRFFYDNALHYQLTSTKKLNSKGELIKTEFTYPHNYTGQAVYNAMINQNIVATPVDVAMYRVEQANDVKLSKVRTNYASFAGNNYLPSSIEKANYATALQVEGTIDSYDALGNITQFTGKDGITHSIIWGYNLMYPVAKVSGLNYTNAVAQLTATAQQFQTLDGDALRNQIQLIRSSFPAALVTTYTYKHLVGVTSITDPANRTSTYVYDAANRLSYIKDHNGHVLKKNEYQYAFPATANFQVYFNAAANQSFSPTNCQSGFVAVSFQYSVPQGKHVSFLSQADADAKAQADIASNGQYFANKQSSCSTNPSNVTCTGIDRKWVDCKCQIGTKYLLSSVQNSNGTWTCTYRYQWGPGDYSASFTEIKNQSCAPAIIDID
jgi:YD repeat-containing protein